MAQTDDNRNVDVAAVLVPSAGGDGSKTLGDTNAAQLSATSVPCSAVYVQADVANGAYLMAIGLSNAPTVTYYATQGELIYISDLNKVWVKMLSGTGKANFRYYA